MDIFRQHLKLQHSQNIWWLEIKTGLEEAGNFLLRRQAKEENNQEQERVK